MLFLGLGEIMNEIHNISGFFIEIMYLLNILIERMLFDLMIYL